MSGGMLFSPNASSLGSPPRGSGGLGSPTSSTHPKPVSQVEILWDPVVVRSELRMASRILSHRCLKLAARWAAEQVVGVPSNDYDYGDDYDDYDDGDEEEEKENENAPKEPRLTNREAYARSLVDLGDFLHAASVLSKPSVDVTTMPGPRQGLTPYGRFLRAYAMYMGGERRKEQDHLEMGSEAHKQKCGCNPYLKQLCKELSEAYNNDQLDVFGYYVYGMVLKEAQKEKLPLPHQPHVVLIEHLLEFPWNWSAWLDFCEVIETKKSLEQEIEQALQPTLATHYMYHFFCAHYMANHHQDYERALILYERLFVPISEPRPVPLFQSAYVKSQLGAVHYQLRDFEAALDCFEQINDPYRLEDKDKYSNILYVRGDRVGLSNLAHQAVVVNKYRPETCCIIANYYSSRQQRDKAVLYFQRALKLDRSFASAWTLMGHEYVEMKLPERAMEAYRQAVTVDSTDYRAWYGLGQTYELLNMPLYALYYYRKAVKLRPYDARMWCAVGSCFLALHRTSDAIRAYENAVARNDTEGMATQKLAALYRNEGKTEEAARCYLRHLELRFLETNSNPNESSSFSPHSGDSSPQWPTLDDIVQGVVVDTLEAEAILFLANYHQIHGEYDTAALFCSRLVEYPGNEKEQAKSMLRDMRARSKRGVTGGVASVPRAHRGGGGFEPLDATSEGADDSNMDDDSSHGPDRSRLFEFSP